MKTLSAVVVAAGNSSRMGINKQQILLDGKPVWMHSVLVFGSMPQTAEIVVVTKEDEIPRMKRQLCDYSVCASTADKITFAVGGATRTDSVAAGVAACHADSDYFAIHDGARPLVAAKDIEKAWTLWKSTMP